VKRLVALLGLLFSLPLAAAEPAPRPAETVLFLGNSFTFAYGSPVQFFHPESVTDLNDEGIGGVPALFKMFTREAGRDYAVSLETAGGKNLDYHVDVRGAAISRAWDHVVAQGFSTLDAKKPGDPTLLVQSAGRLAALLVKANPGVDIRLVATWSRADQTYSKTGHWFGRPIAQMAIDLRAGYELAAHASPAIHDVIPVGEAWNRAMQTGVADPNPYDGVAAGQVDLWTYDHYHASACGYYLEALMDFADLTGLDPRSLGRDERAAFELGLSADQAVALQRVAYEQFAAEKNRPPLVAFSPVKIASH
jgi:hypothetical protein